MSDAVPVQRRTKELNISPRFTNYSKVIIYVDDENVFVAGDDSGRTLEIDNPFGSQELANRILAKLTGYQYQPYTADGALLDPAAEMGDAVSIKDVYGGLYKNSLTFSRLMAADIAAPADEEINHEYQFESPAERRYKRELNDIRASLLVKADEISALVESVEEVVDDKLDATGGTQSFGWTLLSNKWAVKANGQEVFTVDKNGGTFAGKVVAASGKIGGFEITGTTISSYKSGSGSNPSTGVWMSTQPWTDGTVFQVGSRFRVTSDGSLYATNGTFSGTLSAGTIVNGLNVNGTNWTPAQIGGGFGGGISFANATNSGSGSYPSYFRASALVGGTVSISNLLNISPSTFSWNGNTAYKGTITINNQTYNVVRWR